MRLLDHFNAEGGKLLPKLQFTFEMESEGKLPFLDFCVYREGDSLITDVYRKPTSTGRYLHKNSCHAPSTKRGVISCLTNRAVSTVGLENVERLNRELTQVKSDFKQCGYKTHEIEHVVKTVIQKRSGAITKKEKNPSVATVVIPYMPGLGETMKRKGRVSEVNVAFKTGTTLRNVLYNKNHHGSKGVAPSGLVYVINCNCGYVYIGETGNDLKTRLSGHRSDWKLKKLTNSFVIHSLDDVTKEYKLQHYPIWDSARVVHKEKNWKKRKIAEAMLIQSFLPSAKLLNTEFPVPNYQGWDLRRIRNELKEDVLGWNST